MKMENKIVLNNLVSSMEVHREEDGSFMFWIHGSDFGKTIRLDRENAEKLREFLKHDR